MMDDGHGRFVPGDPSRRSSAEQTMGYMIYTETECRVNDSHPQARVIVSSTVWYAGADFLQGRRVLDR